MGNQRCLVFVGLLVCGIYLAVGNNPCTADVIKDDTVKTKVETLTKDKLYKILNGTQIGKNLLHSFLQFSIETGWTANFTLPEGVNIQNIIARVTGPSSSNIDGTLKVDSIGKPVNLFLINPNGILFGPNAKLDLSGSFLASTAESIKFSDGSIFSANPAQDKLLTLGVPAGLQFGANSGPIVGNFTEGENRSFKVKKGQTLALIGGGVTLHGNGNVDTPKDDLSNRLQADNGRVEIASVANGATVGILPPTGDRSLALDFTHTKAFQDIRIDNGLFVGTGGGDLFVYGQNIDLAGGARISTEALNNNKKTQNGGNIKILAQHLNLEQDSKITSSVGRRNNPSAVTHAKAGDIDITAKSVRLDGGSEIIAEARNKPSDGEKITSNGGKITLNVDGPLILQNGIDAENRTQISVFGKQQAGEIEINAQSIFQDKFTAIFAKSTKNDGGRIVLNVKDAIILRHDSKIATSSFRGAGNGGDIVINAGAIAGIPEEKNEIRATANLGDAGKIKITAQGLFGLSDGNGINAVSDFGVSGSVNINRLISNSIISFTEPPAKLQDQPLETVCFDSQRGDRDSFVNSGRGGFPANPSEPTISQAIWQDLRTTPLRTVLQSEANDQRIPLAEKQTPDAKSSKSSKSSKITEAQGWVIEPDGTVRLVTDIATAKGVEPLNQPCLDLAQVEPAQILGFPAGSR